MKTIKPFELKHVPIVLVILFGLLSIVGSGSNPTYYGNTQIRSYNHERPMCRSGLETADFGKKPSNYKSIVKKYMETALKDPDSAKYHWDNAMGPVKGYAYDVATESCKGYGWALCVSVNAKNSYGGYAGPKPTFFLIRDGAVVYHEGGDSKHLTFNCVNFAEQTL